MISAEVILASSTSKSGIRIPLTDDEDFQPSTETTISTSLIHCMPSARNCEQVHTSAGILSSKKSERCRCGEYVKMKIWILQFLLVCTEILRNLPHQGWLNFLLTVRTGISDLELVFVSHSSPPLMSERVPACENSVDSIPADKVQKKTRLDLKKKKKKTFPDIPCVSRMLGSPSLELGISIERLSIPPGIGWGEKNTSLTGNVGMSNAYWFSILKISWIIHTISFCNSCILPVSSRIVSWSSTNLLLAIVECRTLKSLQFFHWNHFNSFIWLSLFSSTARRSQFCFNSCSWRSWWSCRRRSSAWARWSSCCDSIVSFNLVYFFGHNKPGIRLFGSPLGSQRRFAPFVAPGES